MASSFFFIIFLLCISSFTLTPMGVKLPLIHRSSLPEYSNETFEHILETNMKLLTMKFGALDEAKFHAETPMIQFSTIGSVYFVNVTIGTPPVPQYLEVDTGSSLTWVSRRSYPQKQYFYNPEASDTFKYISCGDPICSSDRHFFCLTQKINHCGYTIVYVDGVVSSGVIGYDQFGFVNIDPSNPGSLSIVENVLFGALGYVTDKSNVSNDPQFYGILGLGLASTSLVHHLGPKKLYYCVGNLSIADESNQGFIHFGEVESDYYDFPLTPLIQGGETYVVEIVSICLDNVCLAIDPSVFKKVAGNVYTGATIDTGAILSYLPDVAHDALEEAMADMMKSEKRIRIPADKLCYLGDLNVDVDRETYPLLTINFVGGEIKMTLTVTEYFYQLIPDVYCLSFLKASRFGEGFKNFTLLGIQSQQYHVIAYDLDNWTMGIIGETHCADWP